MRLKIEMLVANDQIGHLMDSGIVILKDTRERFSRR